jgi:glycosyltransferase involved in cell wall biosynthesis
VNAYLEKHRFCERQIKKPVVPGTNTIVVIPCYNEPALLKTLQSLFECEKTFFPAEIIVVINSGEQDAEEVITQNKKTFTDACDWIKNHPHEKLFFQLIQINNFPGKHAGVGLARKIGMDEAAARFDDLSKNEGVIACLDADCTVDKNYLAEIEKHFQQHPKSIGCSIYFEHPIAGNDFEQKIYDGIVNYELFLRYYNRALHYCNFPYAFHTIGSSMAVRNKIYQKQGGMNRRKAGEDFYFLHKIFPLGNFTALNTTRVIPSPRASDRVPFGTGNAMKKFLAADAQSYFTYNVQTFADLKDLFKNVHAFYTSSSHHLIASSLPMSIQKFLSENNFEVKLKEIKQHSASEKMFVKRFFHWFDGFMVLKFVHFARDHFYAQQEIFEAAALLRRRMEDSTEKILLKKDLLVCFRKIERKV